MKERLNRSGVAGKPDNRTRALPVRRIREALGDRRSIGILAPVEGLTHPVLEFEGGDYVAASTRCRVA